MLSTAWSSLALLRPVMITLAPSTASLRAISRPMPAVEPVTRADLSFRCRSMIAPPSMLGAVHACGSSVVEDFGLVGLSFAQGQGARRWLVFAAAVGRKMVHSSDMK